MVFKGCCSPFYGSYFWICKLYPSHLMCCLIILIMVKIAGSRRLALNVGTFLGEKKLEIQYSLMAIPQEVTIGISGNFTW